MKQPQSWSWRKTARILAAIFFIVAGANHFRDPHFYIIIIPPGFPSPAVLVAISGACEIAGGVGLLVPRLRHASGWGLLALLIAVFPANVFMAGWPEKIPQMHFPRWTLWARLPLQFVMIAWVGYAADLWRRRESRNKS